MWDAADAVHRHAPWALRDARREPAWLPLADRDGSVHDKSVVREPARLALSELRGAEARALPAWKDEAGRASPQDRGAAAQPAGPRAVPLTFAPAVAWAAERSACLLADAAHLAGAEPAGVAAFAERPAMVRRRRDAGFPDSPAWAGAVPREFDLAWAWAPMTARASAPAPMDVPARSPQRAAPDGPALAELAARGAPAARPVFRAWAQDEFPRADGSADRWPTADGWAPPAKDAPRQASPPQREVRPWLQARARPERQAQCVSRTGPAILQAPPRGPTYAPPPRARCLRPPLLPASDPEHRNRTGGAA